MPMIGDIVDYLPEVIGDIDANLSQVVPYGVKPVDERMVGNNLGGGEIIVIQGSTGTRKTTFAVNLIVNACLSARIPEGVQICIDTLEAGMTIERYTSIIEAIVATRYMVYWTWVDQNEQSLTKLYRRGMPAGTSIEDVIAAVSCDVNGVNTRECVICPEFFMYGRQTKLQHRAIEAAKALVRTWPLIICGFSEHPDPVKRAKFTVDTTNIEESSARWAMLSNKYNMRWLVIDHLQEYAVKGAASDFETMKVVTSAIGEWQRATRGIVYILSQIGTGSERESRTDKGVKSYAQGGKVLQASSTVTWQVIYDDTKPYIIRLKRPIKSRKGMHTDIAIPIEPISGSFIGRAYEYKPSSGSDDA